MQNILKSEIEGKIKSVNIKAGQSVAVDELLIEFYWFIINIIHEFIISTYLNDNI